MENNLNEVSPVEAGNPEEGNVNVENENAPVVNETTDAPVEAQSDVAETAAPEGDQEASAGDGNEILEQILGSGEQFEDAVETANLQELVFLMERFSEADPDQVRQLIPKFHLLRKAFDKAMKNAETGSPEKFESKWQTAFARFNHKKNEIEEALDKEREENSRLKKALLDQLKEIVEKENAEALNEVREIQKKWKEIGWVKQEDLEQISTRYGHYLDLFYNLRGRFNELLDIDRKHNLEEKQDLINKVTALIPADNGHNWESWRALSDVISQYQELWKSVGPVPRDNHETINESWKSLLDTFYNKRKEFYDLQDEERKVNSEKKESLLQQMRPFKTYVGTRPKEWVESTEAILNLQKEWQAIGPGTTEVNKNLWKEYREIFDTFFKNKQQFYDKMKEEHNNNHSIKMGLVERAEALMGSTDWRETSKLFKELQDDWKKVGPVADRVAQKIWHRFRKACDTFFEARDAHNKAAGNDQNDNLKKKQELIEQLLALPKADGSEEEKSETFNKIQDLWKATGHVPFKYKDEINKAFRDAVISTSRSLNLRGVGGNQSRPYAVDSLSPEERGNAELKKLKERLEFAQKKLSTLENNILMVAKGKSGDGLRAQIQAQIEEEKGKVESIKKNLKDIRKQIDEAAKAAEEAATPAESPENAAPETPSDSAEA